MKQIGLAFHLFGRVVVCVLGSASLIGTVSGLAMSMSRNDLDIVTWFVIVMLALLASFGVWISLSWQDRALEETDEFHADSRCGWFEVFADPELRDLTPNPGRRHAPTQLSRQWAAAADTVIVQLCL